MPDVYASLRSADLLNLGREVQDLIEAGVDGFHLDMMDGRLVPDLALGPHWVKALRGATTLPLDVHLMVEAPLGVARACAEAGADRVSVHVEAAGDLGEVFDAVEEAGSCPGLACFPDTDLRRFEPWLERVHVLNPLGVDPRHGGGYRPETPARVARLVAWRDERKLDYLVLADGGVFWDSREALVAAGADALVGGYPLFAATDRAEAVRRMREGDPA
jgi:ribulose-phosphate 3-epimerase